MIHFSVTKPTQVKRYQQGHPNTEKETGGEKMKMDRKYNNIKHKYSVG